MVDYSISIGSHRSLPGRKVVKVRKRTVNVLPIDGDKLRELIFSKGYITDISEELGYGKTYLTQVCKGRKITQTAALLLDKLYGIKYEDYKPEVKIEKPVQETMPISETVIVNKTELQLKTIISQLAELNNGLTAIYQKLEDFWKVEGASNERIDRDSEGTESTERSV